MSAGVSLSHSLTASIQPHEIAKPMRDHLDDIVRRVAAAAVIQGQGHDFLLRVYLAGMYHGALATERQADDVGWARSGEAG